MTRVRAALAAILAFFIVVPHARAVDDGNAARGRRVFGACGACHSLEPGRNMTGPALAGIWGRKAGSMPDFGRYSAALKASSVVWNDDTLSAWIADPQRVVPGNEMTFPGIKDTRQRADLLAFLKQATKPGAAPPGREQRGRTMGGMGGGQVSNLKKVAPPNLVRTIAYCKDTYMVTTADGQTHKFWERNLRLKTDSSEDGPQKNAPALVGAGMMGDRADVIFAEPGEISAAISPKC